MQLKHVMTLCPPTDWNFNLSLILGIHWLQTSCCEHVLTLLQADLQAELQALYQMPRSPPVEQQKAAVRQELQSLR